MAPVAEQPNRARSTLEGSCKILRTSVVVALTAGLAGCLSPIAMHRAVLEYDRTVSYVEADLLLLNIARAQLYVGPIMYEEVMPVKLERAPHPDEVVRALEKGYRWTPDGGANMYLLKRHALGRVIIANYDPNRLPNEDRRRLQEEAQHLPADYILVDIRPEFPGGAYPLHGTILLRSLNAVLGFIARGIDEEPEFSVDKDPRTGTVVRNPARTLEIEESERKPSDFEFSVEFDKRYYSIRRYPISEGMVPSWNQEAFAVLANLFQMTVTDLTRYPTPAITIAK